VTVLKITHVIGGLDVGGAEKMLLKLVREHEKMGMITQIISLGSLGKIGTELRAAGVVVHTLGAKGRMFPRPKEVLQLLKIVKTFSPNIIQGWMYHGNVAAIFARYLVSTESAIFWNIRQTLGTLADEQPLTRALIRLGARLASATDGVIFNSIESQEQHIGMGYARGKCKFIANGFDLCQYHVDQEQRKIERGKLKLGPNDVLIGHIGRYHPKKDHARFFQAIDQVLQEHRNAYVVTAGRGVSRGNSELKAQLESIPHQDRILMLGEVDDLGPIYQALDILVSSSGWGEGFSNVLGEGMASECFCIATDVGEASQMIGVAGKVVVPRNSAALAGAILEGLSMTVAERQQIGRQARERIERFYSIERISREYLELYDKAEK